MHVHPGIESGPFALSSLVMFLSSLLALGVAAITLKKLEAGSSFLETDFA